MTREERQEVHLRKFSAWSLVAFVLYEDLNKFACQFFEDVRAARGLRAGPEMSRFCENDTFFRRFWLRFR